MTFALDRFKVSDDHPILRKDRHDIGKRTSQLLGWSQALVFGFDWVLISLSPRHAAPALVGQGIVSWIAYLHSSMARRRVGPIVTSVVPWLYLAIALYASAYSSAIRWLDVVFFISIVVPISLSIEVTGTNGLPRRVALQGIPFVILEITNNSFISTVNPISRGHICWILAASAYLSQRTRFRVVLILIGMTGLFVNYSRSGSLGPIASAGAALLVLVLVKRVNGNHRAVGPSVTRHPLLRFIALLGAGAASFTVVRALLREMSNRSPSVTTSMLRIDALRSVFADFSFLGHGVVAFQLGGELALKNLLHPHNLFADAYFTAGVPGLGIVAWYVVVGARKSLKRGDRLLPLYAGVIVAHLFSGGLLTSSLLWLVLAGQWTDRGRFDADDEPSRAQTGTHVPVGRGQGNSFDALRKTE
jgi:hypothetical protein